MGARLSLPSPFARRAPQHAACLTLLLDRRRLMFITYLHLLGSVVQDIKSCRGIDHQKSC
jgi:hypothetical protein